MKTAVVLGGGGFIGGHLANRLKADGYHVTIVDLNFNEYFQINEICDYFIKGDLREPTTVSISIPENVDEVYQLAADMGGAGYISTGINDANVMHNSMLINLNVVNECVKKRAKKVFFSSTACVYAEHNQLTPDAPNCEESSVYPAHPDSEYGWEKLFSERVYLAFSRNYNLNVKIARLHNVFGPHGTWDGGKEKAPAALIRKIVRASPGSSIEVWGDGTQTRSFLYIDECIEAIIRLMGSEFSGPVNIGSEELITINDFAQMIIDISQKKIKIHNLSGEEFLLKYGFKCPVGVMGRNSNNNLYRSKIGWSVSLPLIDGVQKTYEWIKEQVEKEQKSAN